MGWTCDHCGRMMRLRTVAIYPPATTKILQGLRVDLLGLGFTGPPMIFLWEIIADSYESAIRGFWDGEIAVISAVI